MAHESGKPDLDRRRLMKYIGAGTAAGLAGCSTNSDPSDGSSGDGGTSGPSTQVADRTRGDLFSNSSTSTATGLNFLQIADTTTGNRLGRLFDGGGFRIDAETFAGYWFESWNISDDYKKVDIKLRDGLQWGGDYGQLTAEDYIYTLENLVLPSRKNDWYGHPDRGSYRIGADNQPLQYEKTGKLSFTEKLPVTKPQWIHEQALSAFYPAPKDILKQYVPNKDKKGLNKAITQAMKNKKLAQGNLGPYQFEQWDRDSRWVYSRNEDYYMKDVDDEVFNTESGYYDYSKSPYFDEYRTQLFDESSTALSALKTGEIDSAGIGTRNVNSIRGTRGINVWENPFGGGTFWLNLNHRINGWAPIRESAEVRKAMANLYDRKTLIQQVYQGNARPIATFHPDWGPYYPSEDQLFLAEGSIDKAKSLLKSGTSSDYGYDSDGIFRGPDGKQVKLKGVRTTGSEAVEIGSNYMSTRLEKAGIAFDLQSQNWSSLLGNYARNSAANVDGVSEPDWSTGPYNGGPWNQSASKNDWDLMFGLGFSTTPYAPWGTIKVTMPEKGSFNLWGYHQDQMDIGKVLENASTASEPQTTQKKMTELFAFLSQDMPLVWTNSDKVFQGYRESIGGFPGEPKDWGFKAQSYFESPDSSRLLGVKPQQ